MIKIGGKRKEYTNLKKVPFRIFKFKTISIEKLKSVGTVFVKNIAETNNIGKTAKLVEASSFFIRSWN